MIEYKKAILDEETVSQLLRLSLMWANEDISYGLVPNNKADIKEPCYIAIDNGIIVGYIFGHYYDKDNKNSFIPINSKCFDVDELYVLKEYRNNGVGNMLFKMLEKEVSPKVEYITLATSTKDYKKILKFYIEDQNMLFHSAYLIKKIK